ncbi:MAG: hypothetical protein KJP04_09395, partial [Arenicella sp.]|nr:hypothetical protein [Arenicella sp.]
MWSGVSALKNIDRSLQMVRDEVFQLDTDLSQITAGMAANQRHQLMLIKQIAKIRLSELISGELQSSISAVDRQAAELLQQRESAKASLDREMVEINQRLRSLEANREDMLATVNSLSQRIVDIETRVQNQLQDDASYLAQFERARKADSIALEAESKAELASSDMAEKARPYQEEELFMYLWARGYGTTDYTGKLIARFLDAWVARLIDYDPARVNYWNLTEIPKRLAEHAAAVRDAADYQHQILHKVELDALAAAGAKTAEHELQRDRQEIDSVDDEIEEMENLLNEKLEAQSRYISGQDQHILRCVELLSGALQHQDRHILQRYVRDTHSPTDDKLVMELLDVDEKLADVAQDLRAARSLHDAKMSKLKELEDIRRKFKNSRFDDVRSGFENKGLLTNAVTQFLAGLVSGADLWRVLQRNQRYRDVGALPDFGSGG